MRRLGAKLACKLLPQRQRRAEAYLRRDALDRTLGGFQQLLGSDHPFSVQPFRDGRSGGFPKAACKGSAAHRRHVGQRIKRKVFRSEEHTSDLQSLMRISYAVFCSKKKNTK